MPLFAASSRQQKLFHLTDAGISQMIFSNASSWMQIYKVRLNFHLSFFSKGPIKNIPALVQMMAWCGPATSHYLNQWWLASLLTHICVTRPQWCGGSLRWRHNARDSVSNHQPHDCLLNRLFRCKLKKTPKLHLTGLCAGNSSGTGEFHAQMASYVENVSIWWCHHDIV